MTAPRVKLDIDATRERLSALGMFHAVGALEGLLSDAVRTDMPAHVFLDRLLDAERSGREERRISTMLKTAKIPAGQTLENFNFVLAAICPPDRSFSARTPARDRAVAHRNSGDGSMDQER